MTPELTQIAVTLVIFLALFLGSGLWIALSLLGVGWIGLTFFGTVPVEKSLATSVWQTMASWTLAALPCSYGWEKSCSGLGCLKSCSGAWPPGCDGCRGG